MNSDTPPVATATAVPSSRLASRLLNVLVAPGDVFAEVKAMALCHANWLVPAALFLLASWCAAAILFSQEAIRQQMVDVQDRAMQQQFQKQIDAGKMTQAQADQIKASTARFAGIGQMIGGFVAPVFAAGVKVFWGGFIVWVGACFIFKRPVEYLKAVEVSGLSLVILAIGALVKGLLGAALGNLFASPGPVLLLKSFDPTNPLHTSLVGLDVFTLWALVVVSIGLAKLCEVSVVKGMAWVIGVWVVITGAWLGFALGMQKAVATLTGAH
ncbi:MAG TPA: YIP1 family protein [Verrucomicrobiae bacterium]|nr:YIP1 family protein [Verrucomicrobiae bacterium]